MFGLLKKIRSVEFVVEKVGIFIYSRQIRKLSLSTMSFLTGIRFPPVVAVVVVVPVVIVVVVPDGGHLDVGVVGDVVGCLVALHEDPALPKSLPRLVDVKTA